MRIPRDLLFILGGMLLLSLDARAVQQTQTAPQTGSATGAATMATPVTTLPNSSGAGMAPEEVQAEDQQDKAMLPEDANDDQSMVPEDATDTPPAKQDETAPAPATPETPAATTPTPAIPAPAAPVPVAPAATAPSNTAAAARQSGEGCWARLYDAENFIGHNVTLAGDAAMPNMEGTFRSIEIGPNATVITFSEENFADENGRFAAGARVANMREPGVSDEFESLRLTCAQPVVR
jgi:hypothetical protein